MPFLRGSLSFEHFSVSGFDSSSFDDQHIELLAKTPPEESKPRQPKTFTSDFWPATICSIKNSTF